MAGLSGPPHYAIEDFEDTTLIPGLKISYTNPNSASSSTLPALYNEAAIGLYTNNLWNGAHALVNTPQNQEWNHVGLASLADRVTFSIDGGTRSFGIGLSNFQSDRVDHELLVNGTSLISALENLPNWISGVSLRNGYLRIDAEAGESINSVSFDIGVAGLRDGLVMDHLAIDPIPEPTSSSIILLSTALLLGRRRTC